MKGSRAISGLRWAMASERPVSIPLGRPRGKKAAGVRYERELEGALPGVWRRGLWWNFQDFNGPGWCQTDFVLLRSSLAVVLEAKYTWTLEGQEKLERLYCPIVEMAVGRKAVGLVVAKKLLSSMPGIFVVSDLSDAIGLAGRGQKVCLHWLGGRIPGAVEILPDRLVA